MLQRRRTLTGYFSLSPLTLSTQLSIAHSSLSLSLLLPPSPALSFIWGWCYPADTAGCCLVKKCYGWRGFTIIPCSPKNGHISISKGSLLPDISLIFSKHKADSSLQKRSTGCTQINKRNKYISTSKDRHPNTSDYINFHIAEDTEWEQSWHQQAASEATWN